MSASSRRCTIRLLFAALLAGGWCCLAHPVADAGDVDFYRDVYPILKSNCIACHNKTTTKAELNMETPESMRKGGSSGEGVIPGKGAESLIFEAAAHIGDIEMPPKGNKSGALNLTPNELALLKTWIDQGAKSSVKQARQVIWQPLPPGVHPIYAAAMPRDGRFAACGRANQVFVYDLATRRLVTRLADESLDAPGSPRSTGTSHKGLVQSLAFSPDGTRLASGSFREVKIWRRRDVPVATRKGDPGLGAIVSVLAAKGKQLVCADKQGTLHVLETANGRSLKTIPTRFAGGIRLLSVAGDGSKAAVYSADGSLGVWSLEDGRRIAGKQGLVGVRALSWMRDGKAIAAGGEDKVVRLWSLPAEGKSDLVVRKELHGANGTVTALATAADLLIAASLDGKVRVWNVPDGKLVRELAIAGVASLGLSGDGKRFAAGRADGIVQVWEAAAGKLVIELSGDAETNSKLAALQWVIAREGLEIAFQKEEAARIETQTKALGELLKKTNETIASVRKELVEKEKTLRQAIDAHETARKAVTAVEVQVAKAAQVKPDAALEKSLRDARDKLAAAALARSAAQAAFKAIEIHLKDAEAEAGNYAAARTQNQSAVVAAGAAAAGAKAAQDRATAEASATRKLAAAHKLQPLAVRFSEDAETVAVVLGDGSLRVWAVASGLPVSRLPVVGTTTSAVLEACEDGGFVACSADGSTARTSTAVLWILERTLGGDTAASPFVDRVNALRFSPDGKLLAAGGGEPTRSGDISLWDVESGKLIHDWKDRHADTVLSLDFSPDGKRLASGGADKIARVVEVASGKLVHVFEGHTHHVLGVSFRADGRILGTAGADGVLVVWDMISGERKRRIEGWSKEVTSLQFLGATNQILTSAGDNVIRIVDDGGRQIRAMANLPDFMQSAAAAGDFVVAGGEDGLLRVWNGTNGQELAVFGADSNARRP